MKNTYLTFIVFLLCAGAAAQSSVSPAVKLVRGDTPGSLGLFFETDQESLNNEVLSARNLGTEEGYGFYGHTYRGINIPRQSVTDLNGNTYITGTSSHDDLPQGNMFTIKVNAGGQIEWQIREETVDFAVEFGFSITLDENENPIASGVYWNGNNMDIRTVKYDKTTGNIVWESIFDGGHNGLDYPQKTIVNSQGDIIVAGLSYFVNSNGTEAVGYTTLKYNHEGNLLWSVIDEIDIPDVWIEPYAVASDHEGNIAITGYGSDEELYQVFYTIKYSSEGELLWKNKYIHEENGSKTNSVAYDVGFDESGNCFVTGAFATGSIYSKTGTIKYDTDGNLDWLQSYKYNDHITKGYGLKVDSGSVYVAGLQRSNGLVSGSVLISYNTENGEQNWIQETGNLNILGDSPGSYVHLLLDSENQPVIAVRGQDNENHIIQIRKFETNGTLLDEINYTKEANSYFSVGGLMGMGIDQNHNIYLNLNSNYTSLGNVYEFAKLSGSTNETEWENNYTNLGSTNTRLSDAQAAQNGKTITIGDFPSISDDGQYQSNMFIALHGENAEVLWEKIFNEENGNLANSISTAVDTEGNIIVFLQPNPFDNLPLGIKKYNENGELIWEKEKSLYFPEFYNNPVIDQEGNIYIAGSSRETETGFDPLFTIVKYSADGEELWTQYISSGNESDNLYNITTGAIDNLGNITYIGYSGIGSMWSQSTNVVTFQISSAGELNWMSSHIIDGWNSGGTSLFIDELNQVYITGWKEDAVNYNIGELIVLKYDPTGELIWEKSYVQTGRRVRSYDIKPLSTGDIIVTGFSVIDGLNNRIVILKYNENGEQLWVVNSEMDRFYRDLHIDHTDNIYILNQIADSTFPHRIYNALGYYTTNGLLKITQDGNTEEETFALAEIVPTFPVNLVAHDDGRLLLTNYIQYELGHYSGIYFFETEHSTLGTDDPAAGGESGNWLGQNFPNPFKISTQIPFHIENSGNVQIKLFSLQGNLIRKLVERNFEAGKHTVSVNISGLPKGVYIYQIQSNGFKQSRKLIVN